MLKKKKSWMHPFISIPTIRQWDKTYAPSKLHGNLFSCFSVMLLKNQPTTNWIAYISPKIGHR